MTFKFRKGRNGRREIIPINTWHPRKVVNVGGSLMVNLPALLVRYKKLSTGHDMRAGDTVLVGLTADGKFVVKYEPELNGYQLMGFVGGADGDAVDNFEPTEIVLPPTRRPKGEGLKRKKKREDIY